MGTIRDLERILAKVSTKKITPSDLINISKSIKTYSELKQELKSFPKKLLRSVKRKEMEKLQVLAESIEQAINDEIGASLDKGNLIRKGFNKNRDRLAKLANNSAEELLALETRYRKKTGIQKLKLKTNNIAGYFIEVSKSHISKVPKSFQRRQTLVNSERYTTAELIDFERNMITAKEKLERLEKGIFTDLIEELSQQSKNLLNWQTVSASLTFIKAFAGALQEGLTVYIEDKKVLNIKNGWHPLINAQLKDEFVCHDLDLNGESIASLQDPIWQVKRLS